MKVILKTGRYRVFYITYMADDSHNLKDESRYISAYYGDFLTKNMSG
ncbi:hypothetical protein MTBBW1_1290003 [Desulfamplus magnetovallimortis]|uniref:Uncharacterized protein n=1 Tax=Desulfamplus magnetovallimortis TaxID=1246637 RepID=A0A1W1H6X2_9BACT|nr:hypothetical protein MTBBW1_1290003 [Desulfamplus magnetovallimortis]